MPEKPLRHQFNNSDDPAPVQAIQNNLFFGKKRLKYHSAHFAIDPNSTELSVGKAVK
ncbi:MULTISPECIES: hypothetical protein [unclassified Burkholderia]|uniref:hypothetical protein n=1 Tax=unclassified Burkholderia TaxID=2613784 RepID=UPI00162A3C11|nr:MULTISPECIES: hypothetical protein [unclassified Burkholderia]